MGHIQNYAEVAVREMLKEVGLKTLQKTGGTTLFAHDFLDDGSTINLRVEIDVERGEALFDFT